MTLTPAGENLLKDADRILQLLHEAQKTAQEAGDPNGPLRIGSLETAAAVHLPQFFTEYCSRYPKVQLSLSTGDTHTLVQRVLHYELDGAFVYGPVEPNTKILSKSLYFKKNWSWSQISGKAVCKTCCEIRFFILPRAVRTAAK